jgi:hypothetical protein
MYCSFQKFYELKECLLRKCGNAPFPRGTSFLRKLPFRGRSNLFGSVHTGTYYEHITVPVPDFYFTLIL